MLGLPNLPCNHVSAIDVTLESAGVASPKSALGSIQPLPGRNRQNTPLFTLLPPFHHVRVAGLDPFSPRRNRLYAASSTAGLAHISSKASAEQTLLTLAGLAISAPLSRYRTFEQAAMAAFRPRALVRASALPRCRIAARTHSRRASTAAAGLIMLRRGWVVWRPCTTTVEGGRSNASRRCARAWFKHGFKLLFAGESLRSAACTGNASPPEASHFR